MTRASRFIAFLRETYKTKPLPADMQAMLDELDRKTGKCSR